MDQSRMPRILEDRSTVRTSRSHGTTLIGNRPTIITPYLPCKEMVNEIGRSPMRISMSMWDRWAPAAYLLVIGLAAGYGIGLAIGSGGTIGTDPTLLVLLPMAMILVAFIALVIVSKRIVQ
jgi:hypothetical protein